MKTVVTYAVMALIVVSIPTGIVWYGSGAPAAVGVTTAAGVAYGVMVASFALMIRFRDEGGRFLAAWVGGTFARLLALAGTAFAVVRLETLAPVPTLLALASFFFVLLLLEPVYLRDRKPRIGRTGQAK